MDTVTLVDNRNGKKCEFPILKPTAGQDVIDIRTLYRETGMFTYDPGYTSTASCSSEITFIDGDIGKLLYRGYNIVDLATKKEYLDTCFLLLKGELPTDEERATFDADLRELAFVNEGLKDLFKAFPDGAHPMAILASGVAALSTYHFEHLDMAKTEEFELMAKKIIAKIPTLAALSYRKALGKPFVYPDLNRPFTENFLYMLRAYPTGQVQIRDIEVKALDTIFTLHADHEQNASTSTVRAVASTGAHPYAAVSAGISALWGRAHGGANESVMAQLQMIGSVDNIDKFIAKAKDPEDPFKLMGFGHRVYKNFDPRAKILKNLLDQLKSEIDIDLELLKVAERIEEIALSDEYFVKRKLYPNVDFYSGLILTALGIPRSMFTIIFVIGRAVGWISQWTELIHEKGHKIARPRQRYVGPVDKTIE